MPLASEAESLGESLKSCVFPRLGLLRQCQAFYILKLDEIRKARVSSRNEASRRGKMEKNLCIHVHSHIKLSNVRLST